MSERDRSILASLAHYGFLTTYQVEALHFTDHATADAAGRICRRSLARLRRHRLIESLERRIGGLRAGSASYVWRLGAAGDRLLRASDPAQPRARRKEPSTRFLNHRLAVADAAVQLHQADRARQIELITVEAEPGS